MLDSTYSRATKLMGCGRLLIEQVCFHADAKSFDLLTMRVFFRNWHNGDVTTGSICLIMPLQRCPRSYALCALVTSVVKVLPVESHVRFGFNSSSLFLHCSFCRCSHKFSVMYIVSKRPSVCDTFCGLIFEYSRSGSPLPHTICFDDFSG